jgi:FtsP/CotA-like multicopper oxidase with cupredoxin domain
MTVAGLAVAGWPGALRPAQPGHLLRSDLPLPRPYQLPFVVPPEAKPVRTDGATDHYEFTQRVVSHEIVPGHRTQLWTYDGSFPGPTFRVRAGRRITVRHRNELPAPTVVHLHGGHTPHDSDGYPTDLVLPVGTRDAHRWMGMPDMPADPMAVVTTGQRTYTYPLDQRAATLWYHDHRMGFTGDSVWRGLAGFLIVGDDEEDRLGLPDGDRDVPVMLCDRAFAADGSLHYPLDRPGADLEPHGMPGVRSTYMNGLTGDVILVNGVPWPRMDVDRARYRLRILNASNARAYRLALDPPPAEGGGLVQVGSDGGLLDRPLTHDQLDISPAERFDVVVDFSRFRAGTKVELVNLRGSGSTRRVMQFVVGSRQRDDSRIPPRLSRIEPVDPTRAAVRRRFQFRQGSGGNWLINGHEFDPMHAAARPRLGELEIWQLVSDFAHPVHLHLDPFQVLRRNIGGPGDHDHGWKDTVSLRPAEMAEIAVRFTDYTGRYVFHCHNLEHEDMAMMANFVTV